MISILAHYIFPKKYTPQVAIAGAVLLFGLIVAQNVLALGQKPLHISFEWLKIAQTSVFIGVYVDDFSRIFGLLIAFVSMLVVVFSVFYLQKEKNLRRYFVYLHAFTLVMLGLIWADSLILLYVCWEGVGLFSYLLISFWYEKKEAIKASRQAFWVNRVADICLLLGIFGLFLHTNSFQLSEILVFFEKNPQHIFPSMYMYMLVLGAFAKSAQFPLHIWLPNAMTAPTPVSALLHASTMVTAGVYWLYRILPILSPEIKFFLVFIGLFTAFLGAFGAIFQKDIKKMLAYSTMSQLGYMVCAMGLGFGAENAGILHLFTHAFFKAGLFLGAGTVIYALHNLHHAGYDAQDMLQMGGLSYYMPFTAVCMLVFGCALAGLPFTGGFLSKELILQHGWLWASQNWGENAGFFGQNLMYVVPLGLHLVGFMTAFYVFRALFLVFFENRNYILKGILENNKLPHNSNENIDENVDLQQNLAENSNKNLNIKKIDKYYFSTLPLFLLFLGSFGAFFWNFWGNKAWIFSFLQKGKNVNDFSHELHKFEGLVMVISLFGVISMAVLVYFSRTKTWFYTFQNAKHTNIDYIFGYAWEKCLLIFKKICEYLFIFDKKYVDKLFIQTAKVYVVLSHILAWIDKYVVDGLLHFGVFLVRFFGNFFGNFQKGNAQTYVFWAVMALGLLYVFIR